MILAFLLWFSTAFGSDWGRYEAEIVRIKDADTLIVEAVTFPDPKETKQLNIRVFGIDTPEKGHRGKCDLERRKAMEAKQLATELLHNAEALIVYFGGARVRDGFGRYLMRVEADGVDLGEYLIDQGYAYTYYGQTKRSWCN